MLTSPENFRNALRVLITRPRKDMDKTKTAGQIAHTIRSIAKYHLPLSGQDLVVINNITRKLNVSTPGMTDKNRERLAQFRDESVLQQFLTYPSTELERLFRVGVQTQSKALEVFIVNCLGSQYFCANADRQSSRSPTRPSHSSSPAERR